MQITGKLVDASFNGGNSVLRINTDPNNEVVMSGQAPVPGPMNHKIMTVNLPSGMTAEQRAEIALLVDQMVTLEVKAAA